MFSSNGVQKVKCDAERACNFVSKEDETAAAAQYVAAVPHYLEAWGDYELKKGHYALSQPTIKPLFDTQQFQDVLLRLAGKNSKFYWPSSEKKRPKIPNLD